MYRCYFRRFLYSSLAASSLLHMFFALQVTQNVVRVWLRLFTENPILAGKFQYSKFLKIKDFLLKEQVKVGHIDDSTLRKMESKGLTVV